MPTRRELLNRILVGAGAGAIGSVLPHSILGQGVDDALIARVQADLEQHAAFGDKLAGSSGDNQTADWIAGRLLDSGFEVGQPVFDAPYWIQRSASFSVGSASSEVSPQPVVVTTGAEGLTRPVQLVEDAVGDVGGKIALFVLPYGRHAALFPDRGIGQTVMEIADAGAEAIVIVTSGPSGEVVFLNVPLEPFVPVPMALLAPKNAAPLVEAARSGGEATLVIDGESTRRPSRNVLGRLVRGDRWVILSTPRSGWGPCVAERGTGTAAFLEIADWAAKTLPDISVFAMNTGAHEYFFAGSHHAVEAAPPPEDTLVWAHIGATLAARASGEVDGELVPLDTADTGGSLMATDAARDAAAAAFAGLGGLARPGAVRLGAGELGDFTSRGYTSAFAMLGVHDWFHTRLDTLDKTGAAMVVPILEAHRKTIELITAG